MLNCSTCVYLDAENHWCKRRVHNVPGVCPYAEEKKPRNNFEQIKSVSMEEMAVWLDLVRNNKDYPICATDWKNWLKEAIADG